MWQRSRALLLLALILIVSALPAQAREETFSTRLKQEWTVQQAYDSLSIRPLAYNETISRIPEAEQVYLKQLFEITDAAVVEHALALVSFRIKRNGYNENNYKAIMAALQKLPPPTPGLYEAQYLLMQAITEQQHYMAEWAKNPRLPFNEKHPMVRGSHFKIQKAYQRLMQLYMREVEYNRLAFQTHLQALNFLR